MQDIFASVRRSLVFRPPLDNDDSHSPAIGVGALVDKINSSIRKSRVFSRHYSPSSALPPIPKDTDPPIRWRKGELIGCGAFGRVYMGMNLGSGELLAVKQVLIAANGASKEKAQAHVQELEEEVKLLKDLSHPNIVRYLGTVREDDSLNILLEFVPGGSISSLLGKFGAFPEAVLRTYTKQLLLGLEYLHKNGIMHRDIKGANILVDNKGCIKLADFGASKQVVELATISGAKSMKGTPYWMAPEVILQTGHSFSADIWSVGCTFIEMATGKPPWSQQYQEVAALFHIGTTKSHPPIPEQLSVEAKDFLLKCLQKEPNLRPTASELLKHPFVTGEEAESQLASSDACTEPLEIRSPLYTSEHEMSKTATHPGSSDICNLDSLSCSKVYTANKLESDIWRGNSDDEMCQIDDKDDFMLDEVKIGSSIIHENMKSYNPICEPSDDEDCKFDRSPVLDQGSNLHEETLAPGSCSGVLDEDQNFSFPSGRSFSEDEDELTESKIKAFLDEKALELKKLQSPLYEEFYNSLNESCSPVFIESKQNESTPKYLKLPPKSRSPSRSPGNPSPALDAFGTDSPGSGSRGNANDQRSQLNDWKGLLVDGQSESGSPSKHYSEIQRKWKEELDQELERKREMMRQAGAGGKTSSPKDKAMGRPRERTRFASPFRDDATGAGAGRENRENFIS
ncbi:mitogen-activated protein kinase kinase kinase NPK1-like isoform X2 [Benincasa hispida]|uniref:mitogen-activated protein kinase kinase kinase NPK1-like isoform X2 n=1 Tax=Benincasa hispida TaxID=102211 RepID=UPI0019024E66|nr:mitogen-activated protein kinase kinase kinase NPK1-like isoform X2 [Benincasa hispida]